MNKLFLLIVAGAWFLLAGSSDAAVFERDWQAPGDGLLTFDDVSNREWLDLTETILRDFDSGNVGIEGAYQNVLAETAPSGLFAGFSPASSADVIALAHSAGFDTSTLDFDTNEPATRDLIALIEPTFVFGVGFTEGTIGLLDELSIPSPAATPVRLVGSYGVTPPIDKAGLEIRPVTDVGTDSPTSLIGVFLHRNAIPEPSTLGLACFLLIYPVLRRRRL